MPMHPRRDGIDQRPGRVPLVHTTPTTVTYELSILSAEISNGFFVSTPHTRLVIHCDRDGSIVARILNGRTSAA